MQTQLAAVFNRQLLLIALILRLLKCGQHRRDIIFGVSGRKQHTGHGKNLLHTLVDQSVQPHMNIRGGELQKTVLHRQIRKALFQAFGHPAKFALGVFIPAAVAAYHNALFCHFS